MYGHWSCIKNRRSPQANCQNLTPPSPQKIFIYAPAHCNQTCYFLNGGSRSSFEEIKKIIKNIQKRELQEQNSTLKIKS